MKKRFLVNNDAASLWDEFEKNESIEIVGGTSPVQESYDYSASATDIDKDNTVTIWQKSI